MDFEPKKIIVIRLSSIGDILLATPLLRILKKRFPQTAIDFITKKRYFDLVQANPHLNQVYAFDEEIGFSDLRQIKRKIRANGYDTVIDIHKNFRSLYLRCGLEAKILKYSKFRIRRFILIKLGLNLYQKVVPVYQRYIASAASLNVKDDGQGLELFLDPKVELTTDSLLKRCGFQGEHPVVGLAPGAAFETKRWLPDGFAAVARRLAEKDHAQIFLFGDTNDQAITKPIAEAVGTAALDLAGRLSLMETACSMAHCDVVLSNDTGLMHMASALGKKIVAIFGPTTKELGFFPVVRHSKVIQVDLKCRPCSHVGSHKCPKRHFCCMREISSDMVYDAVRNYLKK